MAKPIIAASCTTRNNSVSKLVRTFEYVLECAASSTSNSEAKNRYLRAFETLIELGYKAVKERGVSIHIDSYQKYLRSYIYHSSICLGKQAQSPRLALDNHASQAAQSFVDMLLLAIDSFEKLDYPDYYQNFVQAVNVILENCW